jgi:FkbM family methyltransferase
MSNTLVKILASSISFLTNIQGPERAERNRMILRDELTERHSIETKRGPISLVCNNRREVHYAHHFLEHEPSTIKWIDSFEGPCTFWDVGANIGIYSLYAALRGDVGVYAYEPGASSHAALYANIHANSLDEKIVGLCMGFFNKSNLEQLHLSSVEAGAAMHSFGDIASTPDSNNLTRHLETVLTFSIDDFRKIYQLRAPTYLKIDVDGVEEEILYGATKTLDNKDVRSILVEMIDPAANSSERITDFLKSHNFIERPELNADGNVIFSR